MNNEIKEQFVQAIQFDCEEYLKYTDLKGYSADTWYDSANLTEGLADGTYVLSSEGVLEAQVLKFIFNKGQFLPDGVSILVLKSEKGINIYYFDLLGNLKNTNLLIS